MQMPKPKSKKTLRRKQPRARQQRPLAPMNVGARLRTAQSARKKPEVVTDLLLSVDIPKDTPRGTILLDISLNPTITKRLANLSKAFVKWKMTNCEIQVQTQVPATMGGGLVGGYVPDPSIRLSDGIQVLESLTATNQAKIVKTWESFTVKIPNSKELFVVRGDDSRLSDAGRFYLVVDGPPTDTSSIRVQIRWSVQLLVPFAQDERNILDRLTVTCSALGIQGEGALEKSRNCTIHNWTPQQGFEPPFDSTTPDLDLSRGLHGLPNFSSAGPTIRYFRLDQPAIARPAALFLAVFNQRMLNSTLPDSWRGVFLDMPKYPEPDISVAPAIMLVQHSTLTPVLQEEYLGTQEGSFLVTVHRFLSATRQLQCSKEYRMAQPNPLLTRSLPQENVAMVLSRKLAQMSLVN